MRLGDSCIDNFGLRPYVQMLAFGLGWMMAFSWRQGIEY